MDKLFLGLLFLTVDIRIGLGNMTVDLLPNFAGYLLLGKGFEALQGAVPRFQPIKPWTTALAVYSGALFGLDLLGISFESDLVMWLLGLAAMAAGFYVSHVLVMGIGDLERSNAVDLGSGKLKTMWLYWVIFAIISYLIIWLPLVGTVATVASAILAIAFLLTFYKTKNAWETHQT